MLRIEVISQLSPQDRLVEEWSDLADACAYSTVFQTAEWLVTWWTVVGRSSRGKKLQIITLRDGDTLVGLIPLLLSGWYVLPIRRLSFVGAGATDYNDMIALPGREDEVCEAFYQFLKDRGDWGVLDLRELREGGLLRERAPSKAQGFQYSDFALEECPYLDIPTDVATDQRWQKLLAGFSKKMRGNVGYYERTLQRAFQVDHQVVSREEEIPDAFENLFELHRRRWNRRWLPGVFTGAKTRAFHLAAGRKLLARGWLRLHLLSLDDEVQAALYAFAFHDRTSYYQGGFEPEMARFSLGSVLIANALRQATQEGYSTFDFLRGNEEYKQRWTGGVHRTNIRRLVTRTGASQLALAERVHLLESRIEVKAKELFAGGIVNKASNARQETAKDAIKPDF